MNRVDPTSVHVRVSGDIRGRTRSRPSHLDSRHGSARPAPSTVCSRARPSRIRGAASASRSTELDENHATVTVTMTANNGGPVCLDGTTAFTAPGPGIDSCNEGIVDAGRRGRRRGRRDRHRRHRPGLVGAAAPVAAPRAAAVAPAARPAGAAAAPAARRPARPGARVAVARPARQARGKPVSAAASGPALAVLRARPARPARAAMTAARQARGRVDRSFRRESPVRLAAASCRRASAASPAGARATRPPGRPLLSALCCCCAPASASLSLRAGLGDGL